MVWQAKLGEVMGWDQKTGEKEGNRVDTELRCYRAAGNKDISF